MLLSNTKLAGQQHIPGLGKKHNYGPGPSERRQGGTVCHRRRPQHGNALELHPHGSMLGELGAGTKGGSI